MGELYNLQDVLSNVGALGSSPGFPMIAHGRDAVRGRTGRSAVVPKAPGFRPQDWRRHNIDGVVIRFAVVLHGLPLASADPDPRAFRMRRGV